MESHKLSAELHYDISNYDFSLCTKQLFDSIWKGSDRATIQTLLQAGADFNAKICRGCTPLHVAVVKSSKDIVELLIDSGANVYDIDDEKWTVLHYAAQYSCVEMVQYLLKKGVSIDAMTPNGYTSLYVASKNLRQDIAIFLIDMGANINSNKKCGSWTALMCASRFGSKEVVQHILKKGTSDINAVTITDHTALHIAIVNKQIDIAKLLINCGADVNLYDYMKTTALHFASVFKLVEVMESLFSKGADLNAKDINGYTPLSIAVKKQSINTTEVLLELGADPNYNIQNSNSVSIFSYLIKEWPNVESVKLCIENGAYLKSYDYYAIIKNSILKEHILQNIKMCSQVVINKFNSLDLSELYKIPVGIERLPPMSKLKIVTNKAITHNVEQTVKYEIETNGHCNLLEVRPIVLTFLCVKSFNMYYDGLKCARPLASKRRKRLKKIKK